MPRRTRNKTIKLKLESIKMTKHYCIYCSQKFSNAMFRHDHEMVCHYKPRKKTPCKKCGKKFANKQRYLLHLKNEHCKSNNSVSCDECSLCCRNKSVLRKHILEAHGPKKYSCPDCGLTFVRMSHVGRHMKQTGCGGVGVSSFDCEICGAEFSRKDNLMVHLRAMHIVGSRYDCKQCSASLKSLSRLITHTQKEHTEKLTFECDTCGKSTSSKAALVKHMEIHGEKKHACDVCGYTTFTAEVMRRHILTHVADKPYKCRHCPSSFIQSSQLRHHIHARHTKKHACVVCKQDFKTMSEYAEHTATHAADKKLRCPYDDCANSKKIFQNVHSLCSHMRRHLKTNSDNTRMHKCSVCGKQFASVVLARRHLATHELDRPRRCMYCVQARAYVRGQQLLRHVRKCHHEVFMAHLLHVRNVLHGSNNGRPMTCERLRASEAESILNVMDAEAERILHGYGAGVLYGGMQEAAAQPDQHALDAYAGEDTIDIEVPALEKTADENVEEEEEEGEEEVEYEEDADSTFEGSVERVEESPAEESLAEESPAEESPAEERPAESKPLLGEAALAAALARLLARLVDHATLRALGWPLLPVDQVLEKLIVQCGVPVGARDVPRVQRLRDDARLLLLHVLDDKAVARVLRSHTVDQTVRHILRTMPADDAGPAH